MRFTPNLIVGVAITLLGAFLLLDRLGAVEFRNLVSYWPVLLTLFGVSIVVQALRGDADGAPAGRCRPVVGPGAVLIWIFVWIAVSNANDRRFVSSGASGDPELTLVGVMSQDARTSVATAFRGAQMTSVMGQTRLDLRQATIAPGSDATVDVFGLMGGVVVLVPETWTVDIQATAVMGGIRDRRGAVASDEETEGDSRRARRERRQAAREAPDRVLPPAAASETPAPAPPSGNAAGAAAGAETSPRVSPTPRIVLRGIVMAGGLTIRS